MPVATKEAPRSRKPNADPKDFIDLKYVIHHCGMADHLRASKLQPVQIQEQAIAHSGDVVRAMLSGASVPVHPAPGIQLLAVAIAQSIVQKGAERLASDFDLELGELADHANSEHISFC